ncbi:T9SS type A sorting domain-containing protein [Neolewinella sp.]|uniref:T9SS type A sorting domain-containing protein n=1 Tax=Neolewinella sp. TaxID=2993543 RepID=UPI003B52ADE7
MYYRLRQVDYDGSETYSRIVTVNGDATRELELTVYPNPMGEYLYVTGQAVPILYTNTGKIIATAEQQGLNALHRLNVGHLPPGVYTLRSSGAARTVIKH